MEIEGRFSNSWTSNFKIALEELFIKCFFQIINMASQPEGVGGPFRCLSVRWQTFMLPRLITGNLAVKSKLPFWSGCSLEAVEPHPWKGSIKCFLCAENWYVLKVEQYFRKKHAKYTSELCLLKLEAP